MTCLKFGDIIIFLQGFLSRARFMYIINIKEKIRENQIATLHLMKPTWKLFLIGAIK